MARLALHGWPGNFRELRSVLTRALLQRPAQRRGCAIGLADVNTVLGESSAAAAPSLLQRHAGELVRAEFERCGRSVSLTARSLGISRTTVYRHLDVRGAEAARRAGALARAQSAKGRPT